LDTVGALSAGRRAGLAGAARPRRRRKHGRRRPRAGPAGQRQARYGRDVAAAAVRAGVGGRVVRRLRCGLGAARAAPLPPRLRPQAAGGGQHRHRRRLVRAGVRAPCFLAATAARRSCARRDTLGAYSHSARRCAAAGSHTRRGAPQVRRHRNRLPADQRLRRLAGGTASQVWPAAIAEPAPRWRPSLSAPPRWAAPRAFCGLARGSARRVGPRIRLPLFGTSVAAPRCQSPTRLCAALSARAAAPAAGLVADGLGGRHILPRGRHRRLH